MRQRWFDESDADDLEQVLKSNPGDETHPPGPVRAANVKRCIAAAKGSTGGRASSSSSPISSGKSDDAEALSASAASATQSTASTPLKRSTAAIDAALNALIDAITDLPPFEEKAGAQVTRRIRYTARSRGVCNIKIQGDSTWVGKPNPNVADRAFSFSLGGIAVNAVQEGDGWGARIEGQDGAIRQEMQYPEVDGKQKDDRSGNITQARVVMVKTSEEARRLRGLFQEAARACSGATQAPPR